MDILQIVGIALITTLILLMIKETQPIYALLLSLFAGGFIFYSVIGEVDRILSLIKSLSAQIHLQDVYVETILKVIGIAYIAEFGIQIIRDAGENALANKVEMGGKMAILILAVPIMGAIIQAVINFLP